MRLADTIDLHVHEHTTAKPRERYVIQCASPDQGQWITLSNGIHVFIDKEGGIQKGPKALLKQNVEKLKRKGGTDKKTGVVNVPGAKQKGTRWNPINVGADITRAAKLIAEGKHVTLNQPDQISTLVEKIAQEASEAKAAGKQPPNWNIAQISVPGTNLFAIQNLGVPRVLMPQFAGTVDPGSKAEKLLPKGADIKTAEVDLTPQFIQSLKDSGIKVKEEMVPTNFLRASQGEIDGAKVGAIAKAMDAGHVKEARIFVTKDNYVLDGHHRWAAKMIIDMRDNHPGDIQMPVYKLDMDIGTALSRGREFMAEWGLAKQGMGGPTNVAKK